MQRARPSVLTLSLLSVLSGCDGPMPAGDAGSDASAPVCPPAAAPGGPYFVERTAEWGLSDVLANGFSVADVDGDGFADLLSLDVARYQRGAGRLFLNRPRADGGRAFEDVSASSGFFAADGGVDDRVASHAAFADMDDDGDLDAVTTVFYDGSIPMAESAYVVLNDGTGHFSASPLVNPWLPAQPLTAQLLFLDGNRDGRIDLLFSYWWESPAFSTPFGDAPHYMEGHGDGTFTDVGPERGIYGTRTEPGLFDGTAYRPTFGASACDLDADGRADLLLAAYARFSNLHYRGREGGWDEVGRESGIAADANVDYTEDQAYRCHCAMTPGACPAGTAAPNPSWGCRGFRPGVDDQPAFLGGNTFSLSCGDIDNDGDLDVYSTDIHHPDVPSSDASEILLNDGTGHFTRPGRETMGLVPPIDPTRVDEGGQNGALLDFDGDGWLDVYLGGSPYDDNRGWLFRQSSPGHFEWIGEGGGFYPDCPHGIAIADFDHDGDQDFAVGTYGCGHAEDDEHVRFFENVSPARSFVSLRLSGTDASRTPLGARVSVTAGGITQTTELSGTFGRGGSARDLVVHVGLGDACTIDRIEIRWPDAAGSISVFTDVVANARYQARQGEAELVRLP